MSIFRIVRGMNAVGVKGNWVWNLNRHLPDLNLDAASMQGRHEIMKELSYRARLKGQLSGDAVAQPDVQLVINKIKFNFKCQVAIRNCGGGQAVRTHIKRNIPPVIDSGRKRQSNLADNLRPHVQGGTCILP